MKYQIRIIDTSTHGGNDDGAHTDAARVFCDALRAFAENPAAIDNMQSYLERHFDAWIEKWANTPDGIANEMKHFSEIQ